MLRRAGPYGGIVPDGPRDQERVEKGVARLPEPLPFDVYGLSSAILGSGRDPVSFRAMGYPNPYLAGVETVAAEVAFMAAKVAAPDSPPL